MGFCSPGTNFVEHYECRGTRLIVRHIFITGHKILCVALARSGFIPSYKSVLVAGAKAKTVTNLLILLSVLGLRSIIKLSGRICQLDDLIMKNLAR
jgi:hypothetical protein